MIIYEMIKSFILNFLRYFRIISDLEKDPRCHFDESESIFSRNGLTANRFIKKTEEYNFDNFDIFDNGPLGAHGGKADLFFYAVFELFSGPGKRSAM